MPVNSQPEEHFFLEGPEGPLEAVLRPVAPGTTPRGAAVLFHPHPLFGGTLANKTLYRIARRLPAETAHPVLRINFRGAGKSAGTHDGGRGELEDALVALDWLAERYPDTPITAVGYSFGAAIGLRAAVADERVEALVALGLPLLREWDLRFMEQTERPRLFVQGEKDEFGNEAALQEFVSGLTGPTEVVIIPDAPHLFTGQEDEAVEAVVEYVRRRADN